VKSFFLRGFLIKILKEVEKMGALVFSEKLLPDDNCNYLNSNDLNEESRGSRDFIPRSFNYLGGLQDLDERRLEYRSYKKALQVLSFSTGVYTLLSAFSFLPDRKWVRCLGGAILFKELVSASIKRWVYFGSMLSKLSIIKEELRNDRLKLLGKFDGFEISLYNKNKKRIDAVYFKSPSAKVKAPTVLFCNSNSGFYELNEEWIKQYLKNGVNVFTFNYPGYADSESYPSHRNCFLATEIALRYLKDGIGLRNEQMLAHGHSLGGPHAAYVASKYPGVHLCVDRSFYQLNELVGATYGGEVMGHLFSFFTDFFNLETKKYYKETKGNKWVIQVLGNKDKVIPSNQGMALYAEKVVWHHLNFINAHSDHLSEVEYKEHFNFVQEALKA
jgi:hypothetical protein